MRHSLAVLILAFAAVNTGCDDSPTGPEKDLIGTWVWAGVALGTIELYDDIPRFEIRFNTDGTTNHDQQGGTGKWKIENNKLVIDGDSATYYLDGNDLTLIFTKAEVLSFLYQYVTAEKYKEYDQFFDQLVEPNDTIRLFFKRKS